MAAVELGAFITAHREEILHRCREVVLARRRPAPTDAEIDGIPLFLDRIAAELGDAPTQPFALLHDATRHGRDLFTHGFTLSQVVHDYGDVCQAVTGLAVALQAPISVEDFRTLNRCLDDAIAGAVSEFARQEGIVADDRAFNENRELRRLLFAATSAFEALRVGQVGISGATGDLLGRTLKTLSQRLQ